MKNLCCIAMLLLATTHSYCMRNNLTVVTNTENINDQELNYAVKLHTLFNKALIRVARLDCYRDLINQKEGKIRADNIGVHKYFCSQGTCTASDIKIDSKCSFFAADHLNVLNKLSVTRYTSLYLSPRATFIQSWEKDGVDMGGFKCWIDGADEGILSVWKNSKEYHFKAKYLHLCMVLGVITHARSFEGLLAYLQIDNDLVACSAEVQEPQSWWNSLAEFYGSEKE